MTFEPVKKKRGDTIKSEEWNQILDELANLRRYVDNMAYTVTLAGLSSSVGKAYNLSSGMDTDFNYGDDLVGLIDKQYYVGKAETGEICKFGLMDYADVISYWSGAANGNKEALEINIEYHGTVEPKPSGKLYIHEWSKLQEMGTGKVNNPYVRYWSAPNGHYWYLYDYVNPYPEMPIRFITFRDAGKDTAVRVANVLHYTKRVKQLRPQK